MSDKETLSEKPELLRYDDYRDYIKERIAFERLRNPKLSMLYFAKRFKLSVSFLSMLMSKKKHLSVDTLSDVSEFFQLSQGDRIYLVFTLLELTAKTPRQVKYFKHLRNQTYSLLRIGMEITDFDVDSVDTLYGSELKLILDALVRADNFQNDVDWVLPRLRNRTEGREEVKQALSSVLEARAKLGLGKNDSADFVLPSFDWSETSIFRSGYQIFGRAIAKPEAMMPYMFASGSFIFTQEAYREAFQEFSAFSKRLKEIEAKYPGGDRAMVLSAGLMTGAVASTEPKS